MVDLMLTGLHDPKGPTKVFYIPKFADPKEIKRIVDATKQRPATPIERWLDSWAWV